MTLVSVKPCEVYKTNELLSRGDFLNIQKNTMKLGFKKKNRSNQSHLLIKTLIAN